MRKFLFAAEVASALLAAATPALAASGSVVSFATLTSENTGIVTDNPNNPNGVVFYTADNDGIAYCVSKNGPSAFQIFKSQMFQTSVYFTSTGTVPSALATEAADCPTGVTFVWKVNN